jgi:hypothetical protein
MDPLTKAVQTAIQHAPCSMRALAKQAGVPHSTLVRVNNDEMPASRVVAGKVMLALEQLVVCCNMGILPLNAALTVKKKGGRKR